MGSLEAIEFESFLVGSYCQMATIAFVLYEYIIITQDEIRFFWGKRLTGATVLFWLNKWIIILYYAISFATGFKVPDASCLAITKVLLILDASMYLVWGSFTALRTYALCTNWFIAAIILMLYAVSVGVNMSQFAFGMTGINLPLINCVEMDSTPIDLVKLFTIISRTSLILANCLAIGATWFTMQRDHGFSYVGDSGRRTLAGVLLWDGFIYFLILTIIDSLHMIITLLSINQLITDNISDLTIFSAPLSAILISRFMLHLQHANLRTTGMASSQEPTASNVGSLMFERAFGSLGASISPDDYFATEGGDGDDSVEESLPVEGVAGEEGLGE